MSEDSKPEWPKRIDVNAYEAYNTGKILGLEHKAAIVFSKTFAYHIYTVDVSEDGSARVIALDGLLVLDKQLSDYYEGRVNAQRQD